MPGHRIIAAAAVLVGAFAVGVLTLATIGHSRQVPEAGFSDRAVAARPVVQRVRPPAPPSAAQRRLAERRRLEQGIVWRRSRAVGDPAAGSLIDGVRLPRAGVHFFTWDPVRWSAPNDASRRHGTDRTIRTLLRVAAAYAAANPGAPRIAVGDVSRPQGGSFDARFGVLGEFGGPGTLGHLTHQNGLDVDVYYPRRDRRERAPDSLEDIDLELSQDLVDRLVDAGAQLVFVGPRTGLTGPRGVVQALRRHEDHLHVRLPPGG